MASNVRWEPIDEDLSVPWGKSWFRLTATTIAGAHLPDGFALCRQVAATPLLTPERVEALRHIVEFAGIGVGHDQYDSKLQTIKELLAEMEGAHDEI